MTLANKNDPFKKPAKGWQGRQISKKGLFRNIVLTQSHQALKNRGPLFKKSKKK
jgi:hypothetical protein